MIEQPGSYVDTVCVCLPTLMEKASFRSLRLALVNAQGGRKRRIVFKKRFRPDGSWFWTLFVQQPTIEALSVLQSTPTPNSLLEVHVALDLATDSFSAAEDLQRYVQTRLLKSARPTSFVHWFDDRTAYFGRGTRRGAEVVLYSDLSSKAFGSPCLHIDWRIRGAAAIRKAGLGDMESIARLDHRQFWEQRLSLWSVPSAFAMVAARRRFLRRHCANATYDNDVVEKLVRKLTRAASGPDLTVLANDLLYVLRRLRSFACRRPKRYFARLSHEWMLPSPLNVLWK